MQLGRERGRSAWSGLPCRGRGRRVSVINLLIDPAGRRADIVTDSLACTGPNFRPVSIAGKIVPIVTGRGLGLLGAVGSSSLVPAALVAIAGIYLRSISDAVPILARRLTAVVASERAQHGEAAGGGGCV